MIRFHAIAATAAMALSGAAGVAQAQPAYGSGYGEPPPPPAYGYGYAAQGGGCYGRDRFTLLGAHAGVTVLGVDAGVGAGLSVPTDGGCYGGGVAYTARPYAPPPPQPMYAYQQPYEPSYPQEPQYGCQTCYAPPPPPPQPAYGSPCGCSAPSW